MKALRPYLVLALVALSALFAAACKPKNEASNKEFCMDLARVLSEVYAGRPATDGDYYYAMQLYKQRIANARLTVSRWSGEQHPVRRRAYEYLKASFESLERATAIALNARFPMDARTGAEFKVKLDDGRTKLFETALIVMHPKTGLQLSKDDRKEIAKFTQNLFGEQLRKVDEAVARNGEFDGAAGEVWAAGVMTGQFQEWLKSPKKPNKSPEPTATAVTPRANEGKSK